jgi:signal transduction histidine kinase
MKKIIILFLVITINIYGQKGGQALIDSLLIELGKIKDDTTKINLLNEIAADYQGLNLEKTLHYADQALKLSISVKWKDGMANSYKNIGNYYIGKSDLKNALNNYQKGLNEATSLKLKAKLLMGLGVVCYRQSDYPKALNYYDQSLSMFEEVDDKKSCLKILRNKGMIYLQLEEFQKSLDNYLKYIKISSQINFADYDCDVMHEISICYSNLKKYDEAILYANKALEIAKKTDNLDYKGICLDGLGLIFYTKKSWLKSIDYFIQSLEIFSELGDSVNIAKLTGSIGTCYLALTKETKDEKLKSSYLKKSIEFSNRSLAIGPELAEKTTVQIAYSNLYQLQKMQGNYKDALSSLEKAELFEDSVFNSENKETVKNLEDKRTIELKEKEIQINTIQLENKERQKRYFLGGIILLGIAGSLLFYQSRNRKKTNNQLQKLNAQLDQANKVKTRFFNILNHDLRSPVSNLIHFMHLQRENPELLDEENKKRLESKTMSSAENLLYSMEDILLWSKGQMENFKPFLKQIEVESLFEDTQKHFASEEKVKITFENPNNIKINTDENYLKTIIRNLTGNAIKALNNIENSTIIWKAWEENNLKFLSITDNGKGASDNQFRALYDETEVVGISTGLGLHLIRDLADAIYCKVDVDSKINIGTSFTLKMR